MDYTRLTDDEAMDILLNEYGENEVAMWDDRNHIISPPDVLYYADAYGDLEKAILLQGWDKSLPAVVHRSIAESNIDAFEAVNCHDLETHHCPDCGSDMWEFEINAGAGHTNREWVDEYGNITDDWVVHVTQPEDRYWNAVPEPDHAPVLCVACSHDTGYDFPRRLSHTGSVVVHYGETDERSAFSVKGNLVRFEDMGRDNLTDLFLLPGRDEGLPVALAKGGSAALQEWLKEWGYREIAQDTAKETLQAWQQVKPRAVRRYWREVLEEWAEADETNPDLDFTYVIDFASFGAPSVYVPMEKEDAFLQNIGEAIERKFSN